MVETVRLRDGLRHVVSVDGRTLVGSPDGHGESTATDVTTDCGEWRPMARVQRVYAMTVDCPVCRRINGQH